MNIYSNNYPSLAKYSKSSITRHCRLCAQYVKLKSPATALYKSLTSIEGRHTRYRLTYRTRYSNVVKCFEDL